MVFSLYISLVFSFACIDRQLSFFVLSLLFSTNPSAQALLARGIIAEIHWVSEYSSMPGHECCTVACARVVECARAYAKVCLLYRVTRHVAST